MYDVSIVCTYHDTASYQQKLLEAFSITEFDDLVGKLSLLYQQIGNTVQIKELVAKIGWEPELAFYTLFSYDTFMYMHNFLVQLLSNKPLTCYDYLYSII
jgi:hypothetical protein